MNRVAIGEEHTFEYVSDAKSLDAFVTNGLADVDGATICLDIEEDREVRFLPSVALVQITVGTHDTILDPVLLDYDALAPVIEAICLTSESIIMHGARNDVTGLKRDFGVGPTKLKDTQIAARFTGSSAFGLAPLLNEHFGIALDKALRRSRWIERPLSDKQLEYARCDTRYVGYLWETLVAEVERLGWGDALAQECAAMNDMLAETSTLDRFGWRRVKGSKGLDELAQRRLAALWQWRDAAGRRHDTHVSRTLPPWALLHLAQNTDRVMRESRDIQGLPKSMQRAERDILFDLLSDPPELPEKARPDRRARTTRAERERFEARVERLQHWRLDASERTGIESGFLAPKSLLEQIAGAKVSSADDYYDVADLMQWRCDRFAGEWFALR
ncbi:MAG: ribonuclease D [Bradymonadia bacterium]